MRRRSPRTTHCTYLEQAPCHAPRALPQMPGLSFHHRMLPPSTRMPWGGGTSGALGPRWHRCRSGTLGPQLFQTHVGGRARGRTELDPNRLACVLGRTIRNTVPSHSDD